ncbi:MAG: proline dehydrogenase family protein [Gemmatimonadota bacterium]|nr:proline dehydrogenase family protein [Gemmatimonadota bacterium]MDH5805418.1 proline dehydrogenase family protein [Gemmatimonadota bacterium]
MFRSSLLWLSERQGLFEFVKSNHFARKMASRFVAGETLDEAIAAAKELNAAGISASLDLLGESVTDIEEAEKFRDEVIRILDRIAKEGVEANVSVKPTQFGLDLGVDVCVANMRRVLERAKELDIFVRMDMEGSPYTQPTLDLLYKELFPDFGKVTGVVIQSYMRRSKQDIADLVKLGARVRLCKGAYAEPESVAFQQREEVSKSYRDLAEEMLQHGAYPAMATHDEDIIAHIVAFVKEKSIPPESFEFQMLYGVRRDLQNKLAKDGFNIRVYIPYGTEWYPYLMRRLAERPANLIFMTASVLKEAFGVS